MQYNKESLNEIKMDLFQEESIDFKKYIQLIYQHWVFCTSFIVVVFFIIFFMNKFTISLHKVETKIILSENEDGGLISNPDKIMKELNFGSKNIISNEIEILKSYTLNKKTLEKLDFQISYYAAGKHGFLAKEIYKEAPFKVVTDSNGKNLTNSSVRIDIISQEECKLYTENRKGKVEPSVLRFNQDYTSELFNFKIEKTEKFNLSCINKSFTFSINSIRSISNAYRNKLQIGINDNNGSILTLSSIGNVAGKEADYLNILTREYILYGLEIKNKTALNTISFIDEQLQLVNDSLAKSEGRLQDYRLANQIVDLSTKGNTLFEQLILMQTEQSKIILRKTYLDYLLDFVSENKEIDKILVPSAMGIEDPVLNYLITDLKLCVEEQKKYSFGTRNNHPVLEKQNKKVKDLKDALLENIHTNIAHTNLTLNNLEQQIDSFDKKIQKLPIDERRLINIERKFTVNNNIYKYLLEKRTEAGIAKAANVPYNRVLDPADPGNSQKIRPRNKLNYSIGLLLGIFIPIGLIIIKDYLSNKLKDYNLVKEKVGLPILGKIKHCELKSDMPIKSHPISSVSETFRTLRTNLQFLTHTDKGLTIAVTSADSGEGKTFCSLNLALAIAMTGKKVLLSNLDLRKPENYSFNKSGNNKGLSTFLSGTDTIESIITPCIRDNFYFTSAGKVPPNPLELLFSSRLDEFFAYVKSNFDYIILDTPPVGLVSDVKICSSHCNYVFYVLRMGYSKKGALEILKDINTQPPHNLIGVIINDIKSIHQYNSDYNYYNYYKDYHINKTEETKIVSKIKKGLSQINIFENSNSVN